MRFADNFMPAHQINEMKITQEQIRDISETYRWDYYLL